MPSVSASRGIDFEALIAQTDFIYSQPEVVRNLNDIRQIIVSNNGSVLDEATFSSTALIYFVAKTNMMVPNLSVMTIETRPEYVEAEELELLARALKEGQTPTALEIAVGMEAYDDHLRNKVFKKGLTFAELERLAEKLARHNFRLKCYLMQKPVPGMTDEEAVRDIQDAMDYLDKLATRFNILINMHLNPTYVASNTALEQAFRAGQYQAPYLKDVARAASYAKGKNISVCIGLNDEGMAVAGGSFLRESDQDLVKKITLFNASQDFSLMELESAG